MCYFFTIFAYVCTTDLVKQIHEESNKLIQGSMHSDDWMFNHDTLLLMKAKECTEWMSSNHMLDRWLLPVNGLNSGTLFAGHPIINSSKLMLLDCSLFHNLNSCVQRHICVTWMLPEIDTRKFSLLTEKCKVRSYL